MNQQYQEHQDIEQQQFQDTQIANNNNDVSEKQNFQVNISEKQIRLGFIRKVYGILSIQLSITVLMCTFAIISSGFKSFFINTIAWLPWVCLAIYIVTMIMLVCCRNVARKVPTNYIILLFFTLSISFLVAGSCAFIKPQIVLMAAIFTLGIVVALTFYAITTKSDFTMSGGMLFIACTALFITSFFLIFTQNKIVHIVYCCIGVILFGIYLIYDTQLVVGGKRHQLEMDDYILGALMLYVDIIQIFLYILEILSRSSSN